MSRPNPAAVVLAAGLGTRMRSATPKHFHPLLGRRMVDWVVEAARAVEADPLVVVTSPGGAGAFEGVEVAVQAEPRGTGDALAAARDALDGVEGDLFVLSGDAPALSPGSCATSSRCTAARTQPPRSSPSGRPTHASTAASSATTRAPSGRSSRPVTRRRSNLPWTRSTRRSTSSPPTGSGPRSTGSTRRTHRASCT